jgi:hypothetical protein
MRGLFSAFLLLLFISPALAQEEFRSFSTYIVVEADGSLLVTEEFEYDLRLDKRKRGILRDFPTRYKDRDGNDHVVGFNLISATRNGTEERAKVESISNGVRIRLGQSDFFLPRGIHTYRLKYRTNRQLIYHEDRDELYFNAIGHGWSFVIREGRTSVQLPAGAQIIESNVWTGHEGSTEQNAQIKRINDNEISFRTTKSLLPRQGMTVSVTWPKGFVAVPDLGLKTNWFIRDHFFALLAGLGIFVVLAYYLFAWAWVGRDPKKGPIIARFKPPAGLSAAACQYVMDRGANDRGFSAAIVALAVKGFHSIADGDDDTEFRLERSAENPKLFPGERALGQHLFVGARDYVDIGGKFSQKVKTARDAFETVLDTEYGRENLRRNRGWSFLGLVFSILMVISVAALSGEFERYIPMLAFGLFGTAFFGAMGVGIFKKLRGSSGNSTLRRVMIFAPLLIGVIIVGNIASQFLAIADFTADDIMAAALILTVVVLSLVFAYLLEAPTVTGRALMDEIAGFKLYLEVAEEDLLEFQHPPEKTPELFERYLPFAIALGVENQWGAKFTDILAASTVAPEKGHGWYHGRRFRSGNIGAMAQGLSSGLATAAASASTPPSSSSGGSGGGGSSGGGGGGGGGSSW